MIEAKVLITRRLPEDVLNYAYNNIKDIYVYEGDLPPSKKELLELIKDRDAVLCLLNDRIDKEVIDRAKKLKVISNYAVGYDNIDIEYAKRKGIVVTNTPGVLTEATAELAIALILSASRRIVEADKYTRDGKFKSWHPLLFLGMGISGKTCGIIGLGRIGTAVAKRLESFECRLIYYSRKRNPSIEKKLNIEYKDLEELLKESDIISIHVPLTEETFHLLNRDRLKLLNKNSIIVNTSRGAVIDEKALADLLEIGHIGYAGLDVYENEPEITKKLLKLNNVILTPHIGSATYETRVKMGIIAVDNIIAVLNDNEPKYRVV